MRPVVHSTRELSPATWDDFERLFRPGTGWAFCACMLYQRGRHLKGEEFRTRAASRLENQRQKHELVVAGRAHGILVYDDGEPVGWCQFGPADELPLPGADRVDRRIPPLEPDVDWRITCFVTAVRHRRRGVAAAALDGVLGAIAAAGGGLVEGYPTTTPGDGQWAHAGTVPMYERAGFTEHHRPDAPYVVMRRAIEPSTGGR